MLFSVTYLFKFVLSDGRKEFLCFLSDVQQYWWNSHRKRIYAAVRTYTVGVFLHSRRSRVAHSHCWISQSFFPPFFLGLTTFFPIRWMCVCVCSFLFPSNSTVVLTWLEFCWAKNNKLLLASEQKYAAKCEWNFFPRSFTKFYWVGCK